MIERFDRHELPEPKHEPEEDDIHDNFRQRSEWAHVESSEAADKQPGQRQWRFSKEGQAIQNRMNRDIGEGLAERVASDKLHLTPDPDFDSFYHGADTVYRDKGGRLVIVEAKFTEGGINSLHGDQMQTTWVERTAKKMQTPGHELYTKGNAELGKRIEQWGAGNIRRVVITIEDTGHDVYACAYEGQPDKSWKLIGRWDIMDLEQPML